MIAVSANLKKIKFLKRNNCPIGELKSYKCKTSIVKIYKSYDYETNIGEFNINYCSKCDLGFTEYYPTIQTTKYLYNTRTTSDFNPKSVWFIEWLKNYYAKKLIKKISSCVGGR